MLNVTVDDSKVTLFVDFSSRRMVQYVKQGINKAGAETAKYVQTRHLTGGTTEDRLGVRSGLLRRSAHGLKAMEMGDRIVGGAGAGGNLVYADVHINREGRKLVITPKKAKFLAVPFRGWQSRTGSIGYGRTKQPGPLSYPKGFLTPIKTKKGGLMLAHVERYTKSITTQHKGIKVRMSYKGRGNIKSIVPYYMLLKEVTVPARVFPERVAIVRRRYIVDTVRDEMLKMFKRKTI